MKWTKTRRWMLRELLMYKKNPLSHWMCWPGITNYSNFAIFLFIINQQRLRLEMTKEPKKQKSKPKKTDELEKYFELAEGTKERKKETKMQERKKERKKERKVASKNVRNVTIF